MVMYQVEVWYSDYWETMPSGFIYETTAREKAKSYEDLGDTVRIVKTEVIYETGVYSEL